MYELFSGLVKKAEIEKQSKRWMRRLLELQKNKYKNSTPHTSSLVNSATTAFKNPSIYDADRTVPFFKGTARERLADFKARGVEPRVTQRGVNDYTREYLRRDLEDYTMRARQKHFANHPLVSRVKQLEKTEARVGGIVQKLISRLNPSESVFALKEYRTPVVYGITPHLANLEKSKAANLVARSSNRKGLTSAAVEPQRAYKGDDMTEVLVGGPGIPHDKRDIEMMQRAVGSKNLDEAQNRLYETVVDDVTGRNRFNLKNTYVRDTPENRKLFEISDNASPTTLESVIPTTRDTVFKGGMLGNFSSPAGVRKVIDAIPDQFVESKKLLNKLREDFKEWYGKSPTARWYSPNPAVAAGYADLLGQNLIKVDPKILLKRMRTAPAVNTHSLARSERIIPHMNRLREEIDAVTKKLNGLPVWLQQ